MAEQSHPVEWRVHTSNLLQEILTNHGTGVLTTPLQIFGSLLAEVAKRASELDDPALNILMLRLTLYDQGDPDKHPHTEIDAVIAAQRKRIEDKKP